MRETRREIDSELIQGVGAHPDGKKWRGFFRIPGQADVPCCDEKHGSEELAARHALRIYWATPKRITL